MSKAAYVNGWQGVKTSFLQILGDSVEIVEGKTIGDGACNVYFSVQIIAGSYKGYVKIGNFTDSSSQWVGFVFVRYIRWAGGLCNTKSGLYIFKGKKDVKVAGAQPYPIFINTGTCSSYGQCYSRTSNYDNSNQPLQKFAAVISFQDSFTVYENSLNNPINTIYGVGKRIFAGRPLFTNCCVSIISGVANRARISWGGSYYSFTIAGYRNTPSKGKEALIASGPAGLMTVSTWGTNRDEELYECAYGLCCGYTISPNGDKDILITKPDFSNVVILGGNKDEEAKRIIKWGVARIYGIFEDSVDLMPGSGVYKVYSQGGKDIFGLRLDGNLNFIEACSYGTKYKDDCGSMNDCAYDYGIYCLYYGNELPRFFCDMNCSGYREPPAAYSARCLDPGPRPTDRMRWSAIDFHSGRLYGWGFAYVSSDIAPDSTYVPLAAPNFIACYNDTTLQWHKPLFESAIKQPVLRATQQYIVAAYSKDTSLYCGGYKNGEIVHLVKIHKDGNIIWDKRIVGSPCNSYAVKIHDIYIDRYDNIYIVGQFRGAYDFDPQPGPSQWWLSSDSVDIFVAKYTPTGYLLWAHRIGGKGIDIAYAITGDQWGNIYITGAFEDSVDFDPSINTHYLIAQNGRDIFLAKLDFMGNLLWAHALGGAGTEEAGLALYCDGDNKLWVGGYFSGTADFNPHPTTHTYTISMGYRDGFIAHFLSDGTFQWVETIGSVSGNDQIRKIVVDAAQNIYLLAEVNGNADVDWKGGVYNVQNTTAILCYDAQKKLQWAIANPKNQVIFETFAVDTATKTLYAAGSLLDTTDIDPNVTAMWLYPNPAPGPFGNLLLVKYALTNPTSGYSAQAGGYQDDRGRKVVVDSLGNYYVTGVFKDSVDLDLGNGAYWVYAEDTTYDIFIAKYNAWDELVWAVRVGGNGDDWPYALALDGAALYLVGSFEDTADFDPGIGTLPLIAEGGTDIFIAKFDTSGSVQWAKRIGGLGNDWAEDITIDDQHRLYITGGFEGTVDFDPGINTAYLISAGSTDMFYMCLDSNGYYLWAKRSGGAAADWGNAIAYHEGRLYIAGRFEGNAVFDGVPLNSQGGSDVFFGQWDLDGNARWILSGGGKGDEEGETIATDDERVYIAGHFTDTATFVASGGGGILISQGAEDIFILYYDTLGNFVDAQSIGGKGSDRAHNITIDKTGNLYLTGRFQDTVDFAPGPPQAIAISQGDNDVYLATFSPQLQLIGNLTIGGKGDDFGNGVAVDKNGNMIITGAYSDTIDFAPGPWTIYGIAKGAHDVLLAKYGFHYTTYGEAYIQACDSFYQSPSGNYVWTQPGTYNDTIQASNGVDSIITIYLTLGLNTQAVIDTQVCGVDFYVSPSGAVYTQSGTYVDTIPNASGCDSIITIYLDLGGANTTATIDTSVCGPQYVAPSGAVYTQSGIYVDTIPNAAGCDSIITINLSLAPVIDTTVLVLDGQLVALASPPAQYQWLDCDRNMEPVPGGKTRIFTPFYSGSFAVEVTIGGCKDTSSCYTVLLSSQVLGDGGAVALYPNPTKDKVLLVFPSPQPEVTARLYTLTGKLLASWHEVNVSELSIDLSPWAKGVYLLHVWTSQGEARMRLVKW